MLALFGACLGFASSLFAIEPGFLLMPLLAILLPRPGVAAGATAPVAITTALALLVPLSIAGLRPLPLAESRRVAWLSPAILAAAFFGASLVPLVPGQWLLAGFAVTALTALLRPPATMTLTLAVTPPRRRAQPFAARVEKSMLSAFSGSGMLAARMSISGHVTLGEVERYTKAANNAKLADNAIAALQSARKSDAGSVKSDSVLANTSGYVSQLGLQALEFVGKSKVGGGSDGTRTRGLRRDRPAL